MSKIFVFSKLSILGENRENIVKGNTQKTVAWQISDLQWEGVNIYKIYLSYLWFQTPFNLKIWKNLFVTVFLLAGNPLAQPLLKIIMYVTLESGQRLPTSIWCMYAQCMSNIISINCTPGVGWLPTKFKPREPLGLL